MRIPRIFVDVPPNTVCIFPKNEQGLAVKKEFQNQFRMLVTVKYWHTYEIYTMYIYVSLRDGGPLAYVWGAFRITDKYWKTSNAHRSMARKFARITWEACIPFRGEFIKGLSVLIILVCLSCVQGSSQSSNVEKFFGIFWINLIDLNFYFYSCQFIRQAFLEFQIPYSACWK